MEILFVLQATLCFFAGLLMPLLAKRGPNPWIGIRLDATLRDAEVWREVHRRAAAPFFVMAVIFIALWFWLRDATLDVTQMALVEAAAILIFLAWIVAVVRTVAVKATGKDEVPAAVAKQQRLHFWYGLLIGVVFVVLGLLMPAIADLGPNGGIGIRNARTLASDEVWRATHLRAEIPTVIVGLVWIGLSWLITGGRRVTNRGVAAWYGLLLLLLVVFVVMTYQLSHA